MKKGDTHSFPLVDTFPVEGTKVTLVEEELNQSKVTK